MLPSDAELNVATMRSVLGSGHSRIPVHRPGNRHAPTCSLVHLFSFSLSAAQPNQHYMRQSILYLDTPKSSTCGQGEVVLVSSISAAESKSVYTGSDVYGDMEGRRRASGRFEGVHSVHVQAGHPGADHSEGAGAAGLGGRQAGGGCEDAAAAHAARRYRHVRLT